MEEFAMEREKAPIDIRDFGEMGKCISPGR